ncbi:MAG: methyltransferase domain-containing protein [Gammaproteobacteria bacterium]|nr:methyltransferase domain-containing protein [Gammaproteobacteria bacterium]
MAITAPAAAVAAATAYEQLHVPALFRQFAPLLADAAGIGAGQRVLDVACGTGVVAREAAARVGDDGRVCGLDAAAGMLAVAAQLAPGVDWREGDACALPYADASFDAVTSQFGLMFFPDRARAAAEMLRVLVPGGRFAVAVWDALERSAGYPDLVDLLERRAGRAAADALRAPFVLGDRDALAALFRDAGASTVDVVTHHGTARFPSVRALVEADLRGWLPVMGVELDDDLVESLLAAAEPLLQPYVTPAGTVEFDAPAHLVSGRRATP